MSDQKTYARCQRQIYTESEPAELPVCGRPAPKWLALCDDDDGFSICSRCAAKWSAEGGELQPSDPAERMARYDNAGRILKVSDATHTPGPWSLEYGTTKQDYRVVKVGEGLRSIVADLRSYWVCEEHGTSDANARLIAAAPDLLVAAQWAIAQLADPIHGEGSSYGRDYEYLRAAIARARGEE